MKKTFIPLFFILILSGQSVSQVYNIQLNMLKPLPTLEFADLAMANGLVGAARVFSIVITPQGEQVYIKGYIDWKDVGAKNFIRLLEFTSNPFISKTIFYDEIGSVIKIKESKPNSDGIRKAIEKGKPAGTLLLTIELYDANNNKLASDDEELIFTNPAQTFEILSPAIGSLQEIGNVIAQWTPIIGASEYIVKANLRRNASQSLEDALSAGSPIINGKSVGSAITINLRSLLDREWKAGDEIVLQVEALIPGPAGGTKLMSNIINFFINDPGAPGETALTSALINFLNANQTPAVEQFLRKLMNGQVKINSAAYGDGKMATASELTAILNYLTIKTDEVVEIKLVK